MKWTIVDEEVTIVLGKEFQVCTTIFTKKLSLIVAQEQKLFLTLELNDSLRILRLFPRTLTTGADISTFFSKIYRFHPVNTLNHIQVFQNQLEFLKFIYRK